MNIEKSKLIPLIDLEGDKYFLTDLIKKNKLSLILFYNTNCLGCTGRAIPLAYKLASQHDFINLVVIHSNFRASSFSSEEVLSVFTDHKSPFPIYREAQHELYDSFNCEGTPHWILMDENYQELYSFFGSQEGTQLKLNYAIEEVSLKFS